MGNIPTEFLIETVIRFSIIFVVIIVAMRLIGHRMSSTSSRNEMAALVSLAASVGIPMQTPDRGLLPMIIIALVVVIIHKIVNRLAFSNKEVELAIYGNTTQIVDDGHLLLNELKKIGVGKQRIFAQLRSEGHQHLGSVKDMFMEASGTFTIIPQNPPKPGLTLTPVYDEQLLDELNYTDILVCSNCGSFEKNDSNLCTNCLKKNWTKAVKSNLGH